jgi:hypothetical protein
VPEKTPRRRCPRRWAWNPRCKLAARCPLYGPTHEVHVTATADTKSKLKRLLLAVLGVMALLALLCGSQVVCLRALPQGVLVSECPSGDLIKAPIVDAWGLRRGGEGQVRLAAVAHYTWGPADYAETTGAFVTSTELTMVTAAGKEIPLEAVDGWDRGGGALSAGVVLPPDVPDGEHILRAQINTFGDDLTVDVPLPLYAPARIDVMTDRPLYEPGNTLQMRAVALRAADLTPLSNRPGTWEIRTPDGVVVLEQKAASDDWGVVVGDFPLDPDAESGVWTVTWRSGDDQGAATPLVEPFTLPRFRVEAQPDRPWYRANETPKVEGRVVYASGAPVSGATLAIDWQFSGNWPPPTAWTSGALPSATSSDASGGFALTLPVIPPDLVGTVAVTARIVATDPAGERVVGSASLRFSEDSLAVEPVTELADGLVEGFNNRLYLRTTTPDGVPLAGAKLVIKRAWDPADPGIEAEADADGVAAIQLDPGPPVSVALPIVPVRPPTPPPTVTRTRAATVGGASNVSLGDARALDRAEPGLRVCAELFEGQTSDVSIGLRVGASGTVTDSVSGEGDLSACARWAAHGLRFPTGSARTLSVTWRLQAPDRPRLSVSLSGTPMVDGTLDAALDRAALRARRCLPDGVRSGDAGLHLEWRSWEDQRGHVTVQPNSRTSVLSSATRRCVSNILADAVVGLKSQGDAMGVGTVHVQSAPSRGGTTQPQAQVIDGYELAVIATRDGETLGETTLRMRPGVIPDLRLRAEPVLAEAGETVTLRVLRGPNFSRTLPEKVWLTQPGHAGIEAELDEKTRAASFKLPAQAEGWYSVTLWEARALVWVAPKDTLELSLSSDKPAYTPGETATLTVKTTAGAAGRQASVGLFGVDETLGQIASLPGADALDDLRPVVETPMPAFGTLDGQALTQGRIHGRNAAEAVVLRVGTLPTPSEIDANVDVHHGVSFDPTPPLVDSFYTVLTELHQRVRSWEDEAPKGEMMTPATMAGLWTDALDACADRGDPTADAFGRPLRLSLLPHDMLAMTEPRMVVVDGTRLPEDVENWAAWVAEEKP